jgi:hypothetical protein
LLFRPKRFGALRKSGDDSRLLIIANASFICRTDLVLSLFATNHCELLCCRSFKVRQRIDLGADVVRSLV